MTNPYSSRVKATPHDVTTVVTHRGEPAPNPSVLANTFGFSGFRESNPQTLKP